MTELNKIPPPFNDESQENKFIALALAQVEEQLKNGTASSQTLQHFLKLASKRAQIELEKMKLENAYLEAKIESEKQANQVLSLVTEALDAFKGYSFKPPDSFYD